MAQNQSADLRSRMLQTLRDMHQQSFQSAELRRRMGIPPTNTKATGRFWTAFRWMTRNNVVREADDSDRKRHRKYVVVRQNLRKALEGMGAESARTNDGTPGKDIEALEDELQETLDEIKDARERLHTLTQRMHRLVDGLST